MMRSMLLLAAGLALAGCTNVYESGGEGADVDCHVASPEKLDDGQPNPLRCERVDDNDTGPENATDGTPGEEPGAGSP